MFVEYGFYDKLCTLLHSKHQTKDLSVQSLTITSKVSFETMIFISTLF